MWNVDYRTNTGLLAVLDCDAPGAPSPRMLCTVCYCGKKGKGSPYSITERRVPELIPVLGSQPAGDVSHKPGGGLPLLFTPPPSTLQYPRVEAVVPVAGPVIARPGRC